MKLAKDQTGKLPETAGLHNAMLYALGVLDILHQQHSQAGQEVVITCGVAPRGYGSFHPLGRAVDLRVWYILPDNRKEFADICRARLARFGFHLVLEPDELSDAALAKQGRKRENVAPHYHLELREEWAWLRVLDPDHGIPPLQVQEEHHG